VDVPLVIRRRLTDLGLEQRGLAAAAGVTESYISQLLAGKKAPPTSNRTDIYGKMERFLKLPRGKLSTLADFQRQEELKKKAVAPPKPLHPNFRELVLRKCAKRKQRRVRSIVEKEAFGELERLVAQKLLDVAKTVAREEGESEKWLRLVARLCKRTYEQARVMLIDLLDTDLFTAPMEDCIAFLEPLIESWDIDLNTFGVELALNRRLTQRHRKKFEFVEREPERPFDVEPGLEEFLKDASLCSDASTDEIEFLKSLRFEQRRPTRFYYYRELQNLRDPLHFEPAASYIVKTAPIPRFTK
jgi:transcriptional regulator with XRE-family HTH domain